MTIDVAFTKVKFLAAPDQEIQLKSQKIIEISGSNVLAKGEKGDLSLGVRITKTFDLDGKLIYIPRFFEVGKDEIDQKYSSNGWPGVEDRELSQDQFDRLKFAVKDCRLPPLLAVHLALNTDLDLNNYLPGENDPDTALIAVTGWSRSGKSLGLAVYDKLHCQDSDPKAKVFYFDRLGSGGGEKYREIIDHSDTQTVSDMRDTVLNAFSQGTISEDVQPESLRQSLNRLSEFFLTGINRPEVILMDMNGARQETEGQSRLVHIYDIVSRYSTQLLFLERSDDPDLWRQVPVSERDIKTYVNFLVDNLDRLRDAGMQYYNHAFKQSFSLL